MSGLGPVGGGGDWLRSGIATALANQQAAAQSGQGLFYQQMGPLTGIAQQGLGTTNAQMNDFTQNLGPWLQQQTNNVPGYMNQFMGQGGFQNDLTGAAGQGFGQLGGGLNNFLNGVSNPFMSSIMNLGGNADLAGQNFASGGAAPMLQNAMGAATNAFQSGGAMPGWNTITPTGNDLIGSKGQTGINQALLGSALQEEAVGGMGPMLQQLMAPIQGIIGSQGNNAQSGALMAGGNPLLATEGATALTQNMANQGQKLYNQQALMNPAQAASLAGNTAATNFASQAQRAEQQALARGGGAGATVANGLQNQGMADFADQIAQGVSGAETGALQGQQQMNLQQQGIGEQLAAASGGLQNSLLGTAGGLTGQSGNLANNLFMGGMGLAPTAQNSAMNAVQAYLQGGALGNQNQMGLLNAGTQLGSLASGNFLGGLSNLNNMQGNANQFALGNLNAQNSIGGMLGGLMQGGFGTGSGLYNNMYNAGLGSGQLGLGQFTGMNQAQNASMGNQLQFGNLLNNQFGNYANPLVAAMGQGMDLWKTGLTNQMAPWGNSSQAATAQSPLWSSIIGAAGALIPK